MNGFIHIYSGSGKGKTSAAIGLALRSAAYGKKIAIIQFLKGGGSGEISFIKSLGYDNLKVYNFEKERDFYCCLDEAERAEQKEEIGNAVNFAFELAKNKIDLLVLDEVIDAVNLGIISKETIIELINLCKNKTELVLTGRNPDKTISDLADYHSEIMMLKHPFNNGTAAREGIEF